MRVYCQKLRGKKFFSGYIFFSREIFQHKEKRKMMRYLCILSLFCTGLLFGAPEDPSLIFEADFDKYTASPGKAAGSTAVSGISPDLSLRMFPGAAGKGNAVKLKASERIIYKAHKNFNSRQGTVSFWLAPQEWNPAKKGLSVFFKTTLGKYTFVIYEERQYQVFSFVIVSYKPKYREIGKVRLDMSKGDWKPGVWRKIDAVWNERMMALYLDGSLAKPRRWNKNPCLFDKAMDFQQPGPATPMQLGWGNKNCQDVTAFDDLKIYDRVLSADEIKFKYEERVPRSSLARNPQIMVPNGKGVRLDGQIDEAEWRGSSSLVLRNPGAGEKGSSHSGIVRLKKDQTYLYLAAELQGGEKADVTGNDIVDIWRDDSFEFHIMTARKKRYQFILNSAGALFDAVVDRNDGVYTQRQLNPKWKSGAKYAVKKGRGKWTLEMQIPRKNIGAEANRLKVNFASTRYTDRGQYVNWGTDCKKFYDETRFGTLLFKSSAPAVEMSRCGLEDGEFRLELTPGVSAQLVTADGKIMPRPSGKSWRVALPEGVYEFSARAKDFFYASRITASKPFELDYIGRPSQKRVDVLIDLSGAGSLLRKNISAGKVRCKVELEDGDKKVKSSRVYAVRNLKGTYLLPLPEKLVRGTWQVKAVIIENGKDTLKAGKRLRIPDMTPFKAKVADDHTVPPPWFPVKQLGAGKFEVWNRICSFGKGPFPQQITVGKEKMLQAPPELYLAGKPVLWEQGKVVSKFDDTITLEGRGSAPGLVFSWRSTVAFDGLVSVEIRMSPRSGKTTLSDLKLKWRVPAAFARAMLDPQLTPWQNKENEKLLFPYAHGEDFMIWTMGIKYGFLWHPVSQANWRIPAGHKQFSLKRTGDHVDISADFITVKSTLEREAVYKMVFMATPSRPEPANRRDVNAGHFQGTIKHESFRVQYYLPSRRPRDCSTEPWTGLVALDPVKYQRHIDKLKREGTLYMPYCQPMMLESIDENYDLFFKEWKQIPGYSCGQGISFKTGEHYIPESCCGHTGAEDLGVWRADQHFKDFSDIPGIYYDCAQSRMCSNALHGCAGTDAFGKVYASSGATRHRNFYIRLKRVMARHGKDKMLYIHAHDRFVPFSHGLGDFYATGEQYFNAMVVNPLYFYAENVPQKRFQSLYFTPTKGTGFIFMTAHFYNTAHKRTKEDCTKPAYTFAYMTPCLLHDLNISSHYIHNPSLEPWYVIKNNLKLSQAEFYGYWFSDAVKASEKGVFVSRYTWKKPAPLKHLLVVGNLTRNNVKSDLSVNWKALGLDPARVSLVDMWSGKPLKSLKALHVGNNNFRLIGIKHQ